MVDPYNKNNKRLKNNISKRKFGKSLDDLYDSVNYDLAHILIERTEAEIQTLDIDIYNLSALTHTGSNVKTIFEKMQESRKNNRFVIIREDMMKVLQTLDLSDKVVKKFRCIYADIPWSFNNKNTGGSMTSGAEAKYVTMTHDRVLALGDIIRDVAHKDSILFMWVPTSMQKEATEVMREWGFEYKTKLYWVKTGKMGMGFWFRNSVEELWIGIRGNVKAFNMQQSNAMELDRQEHSHKPQYFRDVIDECVRRSFSELETVEHIKKLELFYAKNHNDYDNIETLRQNGWVLHGYDMDDNEDIANVLIKQYYLEDMSNVISVRSGFRYRVDKYDLGRLATLFREEKNKRMVMSKIYYTKREQPRQEIDLQTYGLHV